MSDEGFSWAIASTGLGAEDESLTTTGAITLIGFLRLVFVSFGFLAAGEPPATDLAQMKERNQSLLLVAFSSQIYLQL